MSRSAFRPLFDGIQEALVDGSDGMTILNSILRDKLHDGIVGPLNPHESTMRNGLLERGFIESFSLKFGHMPLQVVEERGSVKRLKLFSYTNQNVPTRIL